MLLLLDIFKLNVSADEITLIVFMIGALLFIIIGSMKRIFVWGSFYRDLENQLEELKLQLEQAERRNRDTERRLRMMEIIAMRGTSVAEDAVDVLAYIEKRESYEPD